MKNVCWKEFGLLVFVWIAFLGLQIFKVLYHIWLLYYIFLKKVFNKFWSYVIYSLKIGVFLWNRLIQPLVQYGIGCWTCYRYLQDSENFFHIISVMSGNPYPHNYVIPFPPRFLFLLGYQGTRLLAYIRALERYHLREIQTANFALVNWSYIVFVEF